MRLADRLHGEPDSSVESVDRPQVIGLPADH
jgi:hypothetical protein